MATGLESAFDQQEGEDVFAVEEGAPIGYGSLQEALAAGQEAYNTAYSSSVEDSYNSLTDEQKANISAVESSMARSGRDASFQEKENPEIVEYLRLRDAEPQLDLSTLMYGRKTMGRKREDTDFYGEDSPYRTGADAQANIVKDYLEESDTPLYKELEDGTRLYLTTGTSAHFGEEQKGGAGQWVQAGDVGTYSTYWEPKPNLSFLEGMIANPIFRTALAAATGGTSEALIQAGRAVTGEDLNSADWASMITGSDLGSLVAKAAITGDPTKLITSVATDGAIGDALSKIGVPQSLIDDPDFISGIGEAVSTVVEGGDIQDALESGLTEYVKEGGGFGVELPDAPDIDIDLGAIGDVVSNIASGVRDVGSQIGDVTDPLLSTIGDVGSATEDVVRDVGSSIADAAEPFKEPVQTIGRGIDDYLLQPVKDALLTGGGGALVAQPSGTRTTDGLFSSELFKFSPVEFTDVGRTQPRQAPKELVEDIDSNPFASDFDNRNLFG